MSRCRHPDEQTDPHIDDELRKSGGAEECAPHGREADGHLGIAGMALDLGRRVAVGQVFDPGTSDENGYRRTVHTGTANTDDRYAAIRLALDVCTP